MFVPKYTTIEEVGYAEVTGWKARQFFTSFEFRYSNGSNVNMEAYTNARMKVYRSQYNTEAIISVDSYTDQNAGHGHPHGYSVSNFALVFHQSHIDVDIPENKMDVPIGSYTFQLDTKTNANFTYSTLLVGSLTVLPSANGE
jgi:hypothetical protein